MENQIRITLAGNSLAEIGQHAANLSATLAKLNASPAATTKKVVKAVAAETIETGDALPFGDETSEGTMDSFDMMAEETTEETPAPKAKKTATKKITDADVNAAAMAYAKVNGRPATLAILSKKFKVKSILELKADQYEAVIKALEI